MRSACIGAYRDRAAVGARLLQKRGAQSLRARVDQRALIDPVTAIRGDGDHQQLARAARQRSLARLRQLNLDPPLLLESGRNHEKNQQNQQDVDEIDQIDLWVFPIARTQVHAQVSAARPPRASRASTSFMASFSMRMTRRSTLPRKER